ncbi:hypothetical protein ACVCL3_15865 [Rhodanobacter sp. UC4437_H4]
MAREKTTPIDQPADGTLSPAITGDDAGAAASEADTLVGLLQQAAAKPIAPTRTRDRDPADREAWKRERARQLGHHR